MEGPRLLVEALNVAAVTDRDGNAWQYHSRSDRHSKVACWGVALDLVITSSLLRRHIAQNKVVLGVNHRMVDFGTGRAKNLDLVIARPDGPPTNVTFSDLAARYRIPLSDPDRHVLDRVGPWPIAPVGAVLVALEAKAAMTAHIRALPRLYDELNSSHLCVHGASRQALAIGLVMVNASDRFASADLNRGRHSSVALTLSSDAQPRSLRRTIEKVAEIPRRSNVRENGFDGIGVVVVRGVNDGTPYSLVTEPPAPPPGDSFHYDNMILRMANEYDTSFSSV